MKKVLFIVLAMCIATAGVFAQPSGTDIASLIPKIEIPKNQYGNNCQANVRIPEVLNGYKVMKGDVFTLKITYTADKDVTKPIGIGIAGHNPWKPLTWKQPDGQAIPNEKNGGGVLPLSKKGEVVTAEITFTVLVDADGDSPEKNTFTLAIAPKSAGPVTLTVTEFVLTKK